MNRRGLLIANAQAHPTPPQDYVRDGLALFLDGLNQGNTSGKWIDTVNNREFKLTNATQDTNGVSFAAGTARYNVESVPFQTIEIVCSITSGITSFMALFTANKDRNANIYKNNDTLGFGGYTRSPAINLTYNNVQHYSAIYESSVYSSIKVNNVAAQTTSGTNWIAVPNGINIGYYDGSNYKFTGKVYAVRLYNRQLSDDELTQNYLVDKARFNI